MEKEFKTFGHVDGDGNLSIYNRDEFLKNINAYFKNSSVELVLTNRFYSFSDKSRSYYFGVLIPQIQKAWLSYGVLKSKSDVDLELRHKFLYYEELNEETGLFEKVVHTLKKGDSEVSKSMMRDYVEMCIIWTIQNLDWAVSYPSEYINDDDKTEHQKKTENIGANDNRTF